MASDMWQSVLGLKVAQNKEIQSFTVRQWHLQEVFPISATLGLFLRLVGCIWWCSSPDNHLAHLWWTSVIPASLIPKRGVHGPLRRANLNWFQDDRAACTVTVRLMSSGVPLQHWPFFADFAVSFAQLGAGSQNWWDIKTPLLIIESLRKQPTDPVTQGGSHELARKQNPKGSLQSAVDQYY